MDSLLAVKLGDDLIRRCTEGFQIIGAFVVSGHWIPFVLTPWDRTLRAMPYDSRPIPDFVASCFMRLSHALGFDELAIDQAFRTFACRRACGAVAIDFLRSQVLATNRVGSFHAAWEVHHCLRNQFIQAIVVVDDVRRPWFWANGDASESEREWPSEPQSPLTPPSPGLPTGTEAGLASSHMCISVDDRIAQFAVHGLTMADDEIRFHVNTLLVQYMRKRDSSDIPLPVVIAFETLNFLNWTEVGHLLTESWCRAHMDLKRTCHQVVSVILEDDHWLPLWFVPAGEVLVVHTFDDIVDFDIFDGKLRWIGSLLDFQEVVVHRVPNGLPSHRMCGPQALAFLAHILLEVPLPQDLEELNTMRVNMRASFVQAIHTTVVCRCPLVWGAGGTGALLKALSTELCQHGVPDSLAEQRASQAIKAIGSEQLSHALQQKQPWRQLKALANNVNFKFVLPDELEASIAQNKGKAVGKGRSKPPPGLPPTIALDPSKLQVLDGTFRAQNQVCVCSLPFIKLVRSVVDLSSCPMKKLCRTFDQGSWSPMNRWL